jgi:hypothetical protein
MNCFDWISMTLASITSLVVPEEHFPPKWCVPSQIESSDTLNIHYSLPMLLTGMDIERTATTQSRLVGEFERAVRSRVDSLIKMKKRSGESYTVTHNRMASHLSPTGTSVHWILWEQRVGDR